MTAGAASAELLHMLETAGPFGAGHPEPVFAFPSHRVTFADTVGKGHVRLTLADGGGSTLKAIAFKAADTPLGQAILGARGSALHVAGALSLDTWQGQERVQLRVIDVADPQRSRL